MIKFLIYQEFLILDSLLAIKPSVWVGIIKFIVPIPGFLVLLLTVDLKTTQIQGDYFDRRGFRCSEGLDHRLILIWNNPE